LTKKLSHRFKRLGLADPKLLRPIRTSAKQALVDDFDDTIIAHNCLIFKGYDGLESSHLLTNLSPDSSIVYGSAGIRAFGLSEKSWTGSPVPERSRT